MYKKLTHIIAAASLLGASSCCSVIKPQEYHEKNRIMLQGNHQANSLDQLIDTSYCLRVKAEYKTKEGLNLQKSFLGSGFGYRKAGEYYYLITNRHVLGGKKHRYGPLVFHRGKTLTSIIDSKFDQDTSDDIKLELVYEDPIKDLAVLRTKQKINVLGNSYFGDSSSLKYGEEIYVAGFPGGMFKAMTKGVVSNPLRNFRGIKTNILSVRIMQGNSGGPFFAKRGNKYVWMGLVRAYILNGRGLNSELVMAVPSNEIISIADHTIRHADEIIKMVAEKKKTATEKKQNPVPGHPK